MSREIVQFKIAFALLFHQETVSTPLVLQQTSVDYFYRVLKC